LTTCIKRICYVMLCTTALARINTSIKDGYSQGRSDGGISVYIYLPKISPCKLFCALIAADVVRLLVYRTVVSCSKKLYPPKMNFWLRPWLQCHSLCDIIAAFVWLTRQHQVGSPTALKLTSNVAASKARIYARTAANKR